MLVALLVLAASPAVLAAQRFTRDWPVEDRALVADFSVVSAVATALDRVYAVTPNTVVVWRPMERRWEGPFEPPEPTMLDRVGLALADPLDQSLWMARPDGWVHFQPDARLWQRGATIGVVREIAFDQDDPAGGLFLATTAGWQRVPPGGFSAVPSGPPRRPLRPATLEQAFRAVPGLQASAALILNDGRGRVGRYTSAAPAPNGFGWYLGTAGVGLLHMQPGMMQPERLTYGLLGDRAGAVRAVPGGVWVATERSPTADANVAFVAQDLSRFEVRQGSGTFGLGYQQVRRMAVEGSMLWLATDQGLVGVETRQGGSARVERVDMADGLPDNRVLSVVTRRGRLLAGTMRGIGRVTDTLAVERIAPDFIEPAYALEMTGDTVWAGARDGVVAIPPEARNAGRTPGLRESAGFRATVVDLARLADTLVALTVDQLLWRAPGTDTWTLGTPLSPTLGRLAAFVPYRDGFFVAGERGLAWARVDGGPVRPLLAEEHPGRIRDLAIDDTYLWVATEGGLVRWRLRAIAP
jgi:hypothetical protein